MSSGATVHNFKIDFSDIEKGLYQLIKVNVARHASETVEYLVCRILAYCLEFIEHLQFSKGLDDPDAPAIWARDYSDKLTHWIEVGEPSPSKIHKAAKVVENVAIYTFKDSDAYLTLLKNERIHRASEISLRAFNPEFISNIALLLEKSNQWELIFVEGVIYLNIKGESLSTNVENHRIENKK